MIRPRRDVDDIDTLFDRDEAQRLRDQRAEMVENGKRRQEMLDAQDAAQRARAKESMLRATDVAILREYEIAGVEPPIVKGNKPAVSLSLLIRLGWRIEDTGRCEKVLIAPPALPTYVPIQRENS